MYEVLPACDHVYYTYEQLKANFYNKWLFLIDVDVNETGKLLGAKVAVISDEPWGGYNEGVYEQIYVGCEWDFFCDDVELVE